MSIGADALPSEAAMPYRNSTLSEPSRRTASPTTIMRIEHSRRPSLIALPTLRAFLASAAPCEDIQRLCQASMTTAMPSTVALKSSCPAPLAHSAMRPVPSATMPAPSSPTPTGS